MMRNHRTYSYSTACLVQLSVYKDTCLMVKPGPKVLTDLQELRALSHPVRAALLRELAGRDAGLVSRSWRTRCVSRWTG